jgi:APA family basic amino acid/polyamine antiporter
VNIGTLAAFVLVSIGVMVLRRTRADLPRAFKVPGYPVVPILSAIACSLLMGFLTAGTWLRFFVWMAIGLVIYFGYSRTHSRLAHEESSGEPAHEV